MRALVMEGFGATEAAAIREMPMPVAGPDQVVVRMAGAGVNPTDFKEIQGYLGVFYPPYEGPWIPGHDGAGIVEAAGSEARDFSPGDRVLFLSNREAGLQSGTFAEYAVVAARLVARAPKSISLLEASTIPVAAGTAHQALFFEHVGAAGSGQSALIHGGSCGLGSFAVALCADAGIGAAATCRDANAAYVKALGADVTIDYRSGNIVEATRAWRAGGVDVVLDCVSGGQDHSLFDVLKPGGRLVVIATADHDGDVQALMTEAERRGLSAHFCVLDQAGFRATMDQIRAAIDERGLRMPDIATYPLDEAPRALAAMEAGGVRGKIAIGIARL